MEPTIKRPSSSSSSNSYHLGPPWFFRGSALYQLHLVKASIARAFVPKELKLVEAFGYTLGGMFLAHYDDSPAGKFDELVVIAGIVWNQPTSCAWAARVLVSSGDACRHGRKEVGLPSRVATFSKSETFASKGGFLDNQKGERSEISVSEIKGSDDDQLPLCSITLPFAGSEQHQHINWTGRAIRLSLPSFSGKTSECADILKYSCDIDCRVRIVKPAKIRLSAPEIDENFRSEDTTLSFDPPLDDNLERDLSFRILSSKPVLALQFGSLHMQVGAPTLAVQKEKESNRAAKSAIA